MNNIDVNFEKLSEIALKQFKGQKEVFKDKKNKNDPINMADFKDGKEENKQKNKPVDKQFKDLFTPSELENLNNLYLTFSSDEVFNLFK